MKVNFKKLNPNAIAPVFASEFAAGADLYALCEKNINIKPHETEMIHTGLALEIPTGYVGLIFARSGLASKRNLAPANKVGVIDSDYRGEILVALHNHSDEVQTINDKERVAQLIIMPVPEIEYREVNEITDTLRGDNGFGSTGK